MWRPSRATALAQLDDTDVKKQLIGLSVLQQRADSMQGAADLLKDYPECMGKLAALLQPSNSTGGELYVRRSAGSAQTERKVDTSYSYVLPERKVNTSYSYVPERKVNTSYSYVPERKVNTSYSYVPERKVDTSYSYVPERKVDATYTYVPERKVDTSYSYVYGGRKADSSYTYVPERKVDTSYAYTYIPNQHNRTAQDTYGGTDQAKGAQDPPQGPGSSGPNGKLATTVVLLGALETCTKGLGGLGVVGAALNPALVVLKPVTAMVPAIKGILETVEQVRVNKDKARSLGRRVGVLLKHLVWFKDLKALHGLKKGQVELLLGHFESLQSVLNNAVKLVAKCSRPIELKTAVRFLKANLDKEDIKDAENGINKAIMDLNSFVSALDLQQTVGMRQDLQQQAEQAAAIATRLQQAHERDVAELKGCLEVLVGGQEALQEQLAAASQELKAEWAKAADQLFQVAETVGQVAETVDEIKGQVQEVLAYVKEIYSNPHAAACGSSSSTHIAGLLLDRENVLFQETDQPLNRGGFASVYAATYGGQPVVVKQLDMTAFVGASEQEVYYEAAVLKRLDHHPRIVRFYGLLVEAQEGNTASTPAAQGLGNRRNEAGFHDSAGSVPSRRSAAPKLRVGLVMERCDRSLQDKLHANALLPLCDVLDVAAGIADGLTFLHKEEGLQVVHGDLKPANILIEERGERLYAKLADFGLSYTIAVHTNSVAAQELLNKGGGLGGSGAGGTLLWTAPERLEAWAKGWDDPCTAACDMYAFGLILYQLLVGKMPGVQAGRRTSWGSWQQERESQHRQKAPADVLTALQQLAESCCAADAGRRPEAKQVHTQLQELRERLHDPAANN